MEEWDRNDWQGKKKEQVDYSNIVVITCFILFIILLVVLGIFF